MRSFFFYTYHPTGAVATCYPRDLPRWVRQSRYSTVTCYRSKQKSHCVGRGAGGGERGSEQGGAGRRAGKDISRTHSLWLECVPMGVCRCTLRTVLWPAAGSPGPLPSGLPPVALKSTCGNDSLRLRDKGDRVIFYLEYVPSSAGIQRLPATIRLAKPWSNLLWSKDWHLRVIPLHPQKGQEPEKNETRHPLPSPESSLSFIFHMLPLSGVHPFLVPALPSYVLVLREIIAGSRLISSGSVSCNFNTEVGGKGSVLRKREEKTDLKTRKHEEEEIEQSRTGFSLFEVVFPRLCWDLPRERSQKLWECADCIVRSLVKERREPKEKASFSSVKGPPASTCPVWLLLRSILPWLQMRRKTKTIFPTQDM